LIGDASFGADKTNNEKTMHDKVTVSFLSRYYQRKQHEVHSYTVTHLELRGIKIRGDIIP